MPTCACTSSCFFSFFHWPLFRWDILFLSEFYLFLLYFILFYFNLLFSIHFTLFSFICIFLILFYLFLFDLISFHLIHFILFHSIQFISIPECGIAQLSLLLFVSLSVLSAWRQQTATLTLLPRLHSQLSPDSNRLQCPDSCQYTSSIPDWVMRTVNVVCTHILYTAFDCTVVL